VSVADGVLFAPFFRMHALDAGSGKILWTFASGGSVIGGPSIVNGVVYWARVTRRSSPALRTTRCTRHALERARKSSRVVFNLGDHGMHRVGVGSMRRKLEVLSHVLQRAGTVAFHGQHRSQQQVRSRDLMATTEWQAHTVRGFVSILGSKGGEKIDSSKNAAGERTYKIEK